MNHLIVIPDAATKILGYARVSSREQAENSHALEQQIERLMAAGATEILWDVESGSQDDRLMFKQVMMQCQKGDYGQVVVTRLDRLTRSLPTLRKTLQDLQTHGVGLVALDDSINTTTAAGKFQINILGALAEMEVDRLSERVKHGWAHLRARKVAMNPPFGYVKVNDRHELDHKPFLCLLDTQQERSRAQIGREIIETFLERKTLRLTLRCVNERYGIQTFAHNQGKYRKGGRPTRFMFRFSPAGLRNWFTNPVLQGHIGYLRGRERSKKGRAEIHYNTHPDQRLLSDSEFREIEAILSHNRQVKGYGSTSLKYPLSGLIFCAECRSACYSMKGSRGKNQPGYNYYFQCKNWRLRSCSQKSLVRMERAEEAVIQALMRRAEQITTIAQQPEADIESPELQALRVELAYYEAAPGDRAAGIVEELQRQIESLQQAQTHTSEVDEANRDLLLSIFSDLLYWKTLTTSEKQQIYRALVDQVVVRDGQVERVELNV